MRTVPFFNYPEFYTQNESTFLETFKRVGSKGAYIMQSELLEFEKSLAEYSGCNYAVGVANATDGLQILMMAGGIKEGDEIIFCTHTMVATASAIHFAGGVPVPVDAGPDLIMDPQAIEKAITPKTKAICITQLNGRCGDMDSIGAIAKKHDLQIYEDSAQALGSKFGDKAAGTFGVGGCISFYPAKILGCLGDGGAVLCNDKDVYEKMLLLRDHGRSHTTGEVELWGFNTRLDNIHAAMLHEQFKSYDKTIARRREIAEMYNEKLGNISQLSLPVPPSKGDKHFDVFQNYEVLAKDRDSLKNFLKENGVGTLVQWGGKLVHQFPKLGFKQELPYSEKLMSEMIMIPMNLFISDEDVNYVCDKINEFYSK